MPKKPIDHYEHPDTLPNNPTQELSGFAEDEENAPTRYPRDTALDPQLVWKGKDQQNDTDLEVQAVPIYVQEHIQPQAIIENLRAQQRRESDQINILTIGLKMQTTSNKGSPIKQHRMSASQILRITQRLTISIRSMRRNWILFVPK